MEGVLRLLRGLQKMPEERFLGDPYLHAAGERLLHTAVRFLSEMGTMLLGGTPLDPHDPRVVFRQLTESGIFPADLGRRMEGWGGLCETLASATLELGAHRLRAILRNELDDLTEALHCCRERG
jgi:uncharacterized protein YutE (UPF0331/DUF86 family)